MVKVKEVLTRKDQKIFAELHEKMYRKVPQAIPDLIKNEIDNFNPKKNLAYDYCTSKQFLAYKDGVCVGRIAGIISQAANTKWCTKRIRFSRVDFIDDYEVSAALFHAVEDWGRAVGLTEIHGPIGFCDLDQEGMLVEGFEEEGMLITIYNHPYYIEHLERFGYHKDVDWVEFQIGIPNNPDAKMDHLSEAVLKKYNLKLVELNSRREIKTYIKPVLNLLNICYGKLYGTVELSQVQIEKYVNQYKLLMNPEYIKIIENEKKEIIGFGLAVPSLNKAVKRSRGRLLPFGWFRILRGPFIKASILDLYLVGVTPEMQNKGLTAILLNSMTITARKNGVEYAETGPELEINHQVQALWKHYQVRNHKRRRCFIKTLIDDLPNTVDCF